MLLTALPGCATTSAELPLVQAVAVKDSPPADLLACPVAADPFPNDGTAVIPAPVRDAMIGLATAYARVREQVRRLIRWHLPGACD